MTILKLMSASLGQLFLARPLADRRGQRHAAAVADQVEIPEPVGGIADHAPAYYAGLHADWSTRYERNVAVLLRDRATGTPLYEAHAQTSGGTSGDATLLGAMFEAALDGFPATGAKNPRPVQVALP